MNIETMDTANLRLRTLCIGSCVFFVFQLEEVGKDKTKQNCTRFPMDFSYHIGSREAVTDSGLRPCRAKEGAGLRPEGGGTGQFFFAPH